MKAEDMMKKELHMIIEGDVIKKEEDIMLPKEEVVI